ncbi:MAG: hypothetical protein PUF62_03385 [Bacteroidales bacterium]|uniref:hypothetical protein n=1 Tax=Oscillibacter valericigenes TaxID=351091 RepID=UPI001F4359F6|nr:hypothetical protein [Oscillibacter valericigenes]MCF2663080.1 hypothetical protein [Oscillibacter valericigenes]MDD6472067.1 hypothetical protein [Bacteroidales bacterium]
MKKKLITLFMAFTVCLTISLPAYAADMQENTISAEKFYAEIAKEYEKYNIRIEVENIDPTFVYTEKMLEEEVVRVRAELASIENFDEMTGRFVSYNTETESITGTLNEANPASVMPYDKTFKSIHRIENRSVNNGLLYGAAEIQVSINTTIDAQYDRFMSVNNCTSRQYQLGINFESWTQTDYDVKIADYNGEQDTAIEYDVYGTLIVKYTEPTTGVAITYTTDHTLSGRFFVNQR